MKKLRMELSCDVFFLSLVFNFKAGKEIDIDIEGSVLNILLRFEVFF